MNKSPKIQSNQAQQAWEKLKIKSRKSIFKEAEKEMFFLQEALKTLKPKWSQKQKNEKLLEALKYEFEEQFKELLEDGATIDLEVVIKHVIQEDKSWVFVMLAHQHQQKCKDLDAPWLEILKYNFQDIEKYLSYFKELELYPSEKIIDEIWKTSLLDLDVFLKSGFNVFPKNWSEFHQTKLTMILNKMLHPHSWSREEGSLDEIQYIESVSRVISCVEIYEQKNPGLNILKEYQGGYLGTQAWKIMFDILGEQVTQRDLEKLLSLGVYPEFRTESSNSHQIKSWPWIAAEKGAYQAFQFLMKDKIQKKLCQEDAKNWDGTQLERTHYLFIRLILPVLDSVGFDFSKDKYRRKFLYESLNMLTIRNLEVPYSQKELNIFLKNAPLILQREKPKLKSIAEHLELRYAHTFKMKIQDKGVFNWNDFKGMLEKEMLSQNIPSVSSLKSKPQKRI